MIHVIEKKDKYIGGIFDSAYQYGEYVRLIPEELQKNYISYRIKLEYPFYIIEDHNAKENKFVFASEHTILNHLAAHMQLRPDNYSLIIYRFDQDYYGNIKNPGTDYMGATNHSHFDAKDQDFTIAELKECLHTWGEEKEDIHPLDKAPNYSSINYLLKIADEEKK